VAGDAEQLPSSASDALGGQGDFRAEGEQAVSESVLDAALAPACHGRSLRWHYPGPHEGQVASSDMTPVESAHHPVARKTCSVVLQEHGYRTVAHPGRGEWRVDFGVVDPGGPDRFLVGIEFDGPAYAQAVTARDRDRLRPEVLARLGWRLPSHLGHRLAAPP